MTTPIATATSAGVRRKPPSNSPPTVTPRHRSMPPSRWFAAEPAILLHSIRPMPSTARGFLSYVWADQTERKARLNAALDHAAARRERVEMADAAEFLARELAKPPEDGALRVVVHSIFWQYLADPARLGIQTAMLRAAETAPLAWLRLEADGQTPGAGLLVTLFPSGEHHVLARGDFHGRWLRWLSEA